MEFKRKELKVKIYDQEIILKYPTVKEFRKFDKEKNKKNADGFDLMCSFLEAMGMPSDLIDEMYPDDLTKIVNTLVGADQKN